MNTDEKTPLKAVHQVQAIAAILIAFSDSTFDRGDHHAALLWLGFKLDEAGALLAAEVKS